MAGVQPGGRPGGRRPKTRRSRGGFQGGPGPDDTEMDRFEADLRARGVPLASYGCFSAEDVAGHVGWILHTARSNTSSRGQEVVVVMLSGDGAVVTGNPPWPPEGSPAREEILRIRTENLEEILPGARPGAVVAGPLTPLVYRHRSSAGTGPTGRAERAAQRAGA